MIRQWRNTVDDGESWTWQKDYIRRNGQLLASVTPDEERHYHLDHLGTPRLITSHQGLEQARHTYFPYGQEATDPTQNNERMKFTGHERDLNSPSPADDLDYMHQRYCSPNQGRFLSVDRVLGKPGNPQSWNRFLYAQGNPVKYVDPDGNAPHAFLLFTGEASDLILHSAIYIQDSDPERPIDQVFSHGGQAAGTRSLDDYLAIYDNSTRDPTTAFKLELTETEAEALLIVLKSDVNPVSGAIETRYEPLTNNCAQFCKQRVEVVSKGGGWERSVRRAIRNAIKGATITSQGLFLDLVALGLIDPLDGSLAEEILPGATAGEN